MLHGAKPLSNKNSWADEGQSKSAKMKHSDQKGALRKTTLRRTEPYKMLKRTTKPLRRRVLTEEGLPKRSKMQHSENTDK